MAEPANPFRKEKPGEENLSAPVSVETSPNGGIVKPLYATRHMRCYSVTDEELNSVSVWNAQSTTFFSVGSFMLSLGVGFLADGIFAETLTPAGQALHQAGSWICILISFAFFYLGWQAREARKKLVDKIKEQSRHN